jgi:DNA-binding beta-propeller fold protein YncE
MDRRRFLAAAGAGSLALALDPLGVVARASGGVSTAFVTADLESHVVAVDLRSRRVVGRFDTAPGPRSIESLGAEAAVVGHTEAGVVSILSAAGGLRAEQDGLEAPRYTAIHPRGAYVYVTDSALEEVVVLDPIDARILWRARVPGPARHISISSDGRVAWAVLGNAAPRVAVLDASAARRPKFVRTFAPPFLAHDVVFAPDGVGAWLTSGDERRIALYARDGRLQRLLSAGSPPQHVTFTLEKAFVASGDDGTVRRHRLDGSFVREARVPHGSFNVTFDGRGIVTPSLTQGTLTLLDRNGHVTAVRKVARAAHDACIVYSTSRRSR